LVVGIFKVDVAEGVRDYLVGEEIAPYQSHGRTPASRQVEHRELLMGVFIFVLYLDVHHRFRVLNVVASVFLNQLSPPILGPKEKSILSDFPTPCFLRIPYMDAIEIPA
jgi:hypothetical protein